MSAQGLAEKPNKKTRRGSGNVTRSETLTYSTRLIEITRPLFFSSTMSFDLSHVNVGKQINVNRTINHSGPTPQSNRSWYIHKKIK